MAEVKKKIAKVKKGKGEFIRLKDLPKKYFPRSTKAKEYLKDLIRTHSDIIYTNRKVQYSAQICSFNIKCISSKNDFIPSPPEVFREIQEFKYHYENYCFRLYVYREKMIQFINAFMPIGYEDNEIRIKHLLINPVIKQAGLLFIFRKFKENTYLSNVIASREKLTHKLFYGKDFDALFRPLGDKKGGTKKTEEEFKKWTDNWKKEIQQRAEETNRCTAILRKTDPALANKLIQFKSKIKK